MLQRADVVCLPSSPYNLGIAQSPGGGEGGGDEKEGRIYAFQRVQVV